MRGPCRARGLIRRAIASTSARACASVTPGRIRPMTRRNRLPARAALEVVPERQPGLQAIGHARVGRQQQPEVRGMTPTTVVSSIVDEDLRPTIDGSPPKRRWNRSQPRRIVGGGARRAVLGAERASERGLGAEHLKEVGGDERRCGAAPDRPSPVSAIVPVAQIAANSAHVVLPSRRSPDRDRTAARAGSRLRSCRARRRRAGRRRDTAAARAASRGRR